MESASRQRSRRFGRSAGARTRSAADYSITATLSVVPDPLDTYTYDQRVKMISALRYVDEVVPYTAIDESIKGIDFTIFAMGGDQNHAGFQRAKVWCEKNGREVVVMSRTPGICSSQLRI